MVEKNKVIYPIEKNKSSGITTTDDIDIMEILYAPLKPEETEKLRLERFTREGIDEDLNNPVKRFNQLIADLRYLGNAGFAHFGQEGTWKEWTKEDILKYFAVCVDALRSIYISLIPPTNEELFKKEHSKKDPAEARKTSYWQCYIEAEKYMESKPPKDDNELKEWHDKRKELLKKENESVEKKEETDFLNVNPGTFKDLADEEIEKLHKEGHTYWRLHETGELKDTELLINNHVLLVQEMLGRNLKHSNSGGLDSASLRFFPGYDKKEYMDSAEDGETIYKALDEEDYFKRSFTYEDVPDEEQESKFVMQIHHRGCSSHLDFLAEAKDRKYLIGFTINDLIEGSIKEPVLTMAQAEALLDNENISKIDWSTGKFKTRKTTSGNIAPMELRAEEKKPGPSAWILVQGVVPKGSIGSTHEYPGVFIIRDKGILEYGMNKPYFKEFFLDGERLKGRLIFRQLTPWSIKSLDFEKILPPPKGEEVSRSGIFWTAIQSLEQLPYVLSDRAVKKASVPPQGFSALPKVLKKQVPQEFQYWTKSSEKDRIKIRDAYVEYLKKENKYEKLSKSLDLSDDRPVADFNHWVVREFLECKIKDVFGNSVFIPAPKMGNFLKAFREVTKNFQLLDTRNFDRQGYESPPISQVIKLNSKVEEDFLINGMQFLENNLGQRYVAKFSPTYGGLDFTFISRSIFKELNKKLLSDTFGWVKEHNYLKNEKFTLSGEFLTAPKDLDWEDLKLEKSLKDSILKANELLTKEGMLYSRGILMLGRPGTGKTLSCKLLMKNTQSTFIWVTAKEFDNSALSMAFDLARELAPTILCFEDIDTYIGGHCVDLFKTELDGLISNEGICVILTTNHPENLPPALLDRPGRFHDICNFVLPNPEVRKEMILHFSKMDVRLDVLKQLVEDTEGFSGAHIKELVSFAKRIQNEEKNSLEDAFLISLEKMKKQKNLVAEIMENKETPGICLERR
jgi:hypothetical protein